MTQATADDQRRQLRASFEDLLQQQPDLSSQDRAFLLSKLNEALDKQDLNAPIQIDPEGMRRDWAAAVDALMPEADASEREFQIRRFNDTLEPLQRDAVQDALEYGRRLREDGEIAAAEWLNERNAQRKKRKTAAAVTNSTADSGSKRAAPRNPWGNGG